jgi:uncharacterized NAD(P)/FAD-binding protein YdhS
MKSITIIGGGASGTLLAINLLRAEHFETFTVNLIERREKVGVGVAFSTDKDTHLLNVPAGKMGAFPDEIDHFHRWLKGNGYEYSADDFVPRKIFGQYLRGLLQAAAESPVDSPRLRLINDEAIDVQLNGKPRVLLNSGETLDTDKVVLAFGNFLPPQPNVPDLAFTSSPKYFRSPWTNDLYGTIEPHNSVFIIGTGLSMADVALHLDKVGHRGKIIAISTRGLLPTVHRLGYSYPSFYDELRPLRRITDILKVVRRHAQNAQRDSSDWRAVIDSLRPHTQEIWTSLPAEEKEYFRLHLSRYWDVARHRMPPAAAEKLGELRLSGQLEIVKGRLRDIRSNGSGFQISYSADGVQNLASADVLVNCIGSETDYKKIDTPLVRNLIDQGIIQPDALRLGLNATPDGHIIGLDNKPSNVMFTLGTALKGILWESTAIPEIRAQARLLAAKLLSE